MLLFVLPGYLANETARRIRKQRDTQELDKLFACLLFSLAIYSSFSFFAPLMPDYISPVFLIKSSELLSVESVIGLLILFGASLSSGLFYGAFCKYVIDIRKGHVKGHGLWDHIFVSGKRGAHTKNRKKVIK